MKDLVNLPAFLAAAAVTIFLPGPATLLVATHATTSRRAALVATVGIIAGDAIAITLAGAGLASALERCHGLMQAMRLVGAAYIAWLGILMLRQPASAPRDVVRPAPSSVRCFTQALAMTLANPKAMLFFAAFFPLFVAPGVVAPLPAFWRLGALFEMINLSWFAAVVTLADGFGERPSVLGVAPQRIGGLALIGCAALALLA
jgi:leucine efflux protein